MGWRRVVHRRVPRVEEDSSTWARPDRVAVAGGFACSVGPPSSATADASGPRPDPSSARGSAPADPAVSASPAPRAASPRAAVSVSEAAVSRDRPLLHAPPRARLASSLSGAGRPSRQNPPWLDLRILDTSSQPARSVLLGKVSVDTGISPHPSLRRGGLGALR
ncbi:unnamed protein product [Diplocarpon coronariae]|uniref:Uncharacterized protein n=1 Tax=Diplocarpon coronariae TaxID=2795749 RepID=A0A218Z2E1_9HELO|nr:hypothetical protein JHW43_004617 [Diplocarpon mali]OWP01445.1 hypothetical protein B2J93_2855 [Marssonina coronariae]